MMDFSRNLENCGYSDLLSVEVDPIVINSARMKTYSKNHQIIKLCILALILIILGTSCSNQKSQPNQSTESVSNLSNHAEPNVSPTTTPSPTITQTNTPTLTPTIIATQPIEPTPVPEVIDSTNFQELLELEEGAIQFSSVLLTGDWQPEGDLLALSSGENLILYDLKNERLVYETSVGVYTRAIKFDPNQPQIFATGSNDGVIRVWDINSPQILQAIEAHTKGINQLAFQPNGNLIASAGNDALVYLWDPVTGEQVNSLIGGAFVVPDLDFTQDGSRILTVDGGVIRYREVETGRLVTSIHTEGSVPAIATSPDGSVIAAAHEGGTIQFWDLNTGEKLSEISISNESEAWILVYNAKGDLLATGWRDGSICWIPVTDLENYQCVRGHNRPVSIVLFSHDGSTFVSGSYDGWLRQWQVHQAND